MGKLSVLIVITILCLSMFSFLRIARASSRTIIVPNDYSTIQAAINAADDGDTIFVRDGTYQEDLDINKSITLMGESNQNTIIEVSSTGLVYTGIAIDADNVILENFNILGTNALGGGLIFGGSQNGASFYLSNVVIRNNRITSSMNGASDSLDLLNSYGNIVEDNQIIVGDNSGSGIAIGIGSNNTIEGNTVVGGWTCIAVLLTNHDTIADNYVTNQTLTGGYSYIGAIYLADEKEDLVFGNTISNNALGLTLDASDCSVYHNNFIHNCEQALTVNGSQAAFDNGYPSGGNYWSDYNGTDNFSGPYQNVTGSDGVGDTPYIIDSNNTDNYPLMSPWAPPQIALRSLTFSKTVVGLGFNESIVLTLENPSNNVEALSVSLFANGAFIGSQTITPANRNSSLSFVWNTTGFAYGTYSVIAFATPSGSELSAASETIIAGSVIVGIPGDVNGSGRVSLVDLVTVAMAYGSTPGSPKWNPNADINGDGKVDLSDLASLAMHYGQHYP